MKTYKVWVTQTTYLYAYVEAESQEQAWDLAYEKDGSEFMDCARKYGRKTISI